MAGISNSKRTFKDLRKAILLCLAGGQHTINQISFKTRIKWKTVELHLTYLVGRGFVNEVFSSQYARIFELTQDGVGYVKTLGVISVEKNDIVEDRELKL